MSSIIKDDSLIDSLIEYGFEGIILFDRMGMITYANRTAKRYLGFSVLEGVQMSAIFPGTFSVSREGFSTDVSLEGSAFERNAYRQNMTCFKIRGQIHKADNNEYALQFYNISRLEGLEKEVESIRENATDSEQIKNEFVANVTHELRTPVNGIAGNTRELMTHNLPAEDMKLLHLIERGCEDMNALINNILDFSKLESGKFQLEPREFNFRSMMDYVRNNHINKIHDKGLEFYCTVSGDIPDVVIGDELRIVQILNNLLSNAIKFTQIGRVMIEAVPTAAEDGRIEIFFMVIDTGIGIDKKNQDKLFKSFSQVEASISRRFGGTGLGLNISKQLVDLMGGHISVESEVGKGTTFNFSVWLDLPENTSHLNIDFSQAGKSSHNEEFQKSMEKTFGTPDNLKEIDNRLTKLSLCLDMGNWEKAETFADAIKALTDGAPHEISSQILRLKMAVQKENKEKAFTAIDNIRETIISGIIPSDGE